MYSNDINDFHRMRAFVSIAFAMDLGTDVIVMTWNARVLEIAIFFDVLSDIIVAITAAWLILLHYRLRSYYTAFFPFFLNDDRGYSVTDRVLTSADRRSREYPQIPGSNS